MNYFRRAKDFASDTICANIPAIYCGYTCVQLYYGCKSTVTYVYGTQHRKYFLKNLQDVVHKRGAMKHLLVDSCRMK